MAVALCAGFIALGETEAYAAIEVSSAATQIDEDYEVTIPEEGSYTIEGADSGSYIENHFLTGTNFYIYIEEEVEATSATLTSIVDTGDPTSGMSILLYVLLIVTAFMLMGDCIFEIFTVKRRI